MTRSDSEYQYVGNELDVFAHAVNWKSYFKSHLSAFITGDVLEVGAGIGTTTRILCDGFQRSRTCLEPDPSLVKRLKQAADDKPFALPVQITTGTLEDLAPALRFDTLLYIDVLEHIENDEAEMARAAARLNPGGTLVVLCPAHQALYTTFDRVIGHHRRYNKVMFRAIAPSDMVQEKLIYLDAVGLMLSAANRLLLRSGSPTIGQVKLWDRIFVRGSRLIDPLLANSVGKSIVGVWRKASSAQAVQYQAYGREHK